MKKHFYICIGLLLHVLYGSLLIKLGFSSQEVFASVSTGFLLFTIGFIMGYWY